MSKVYSLKHIDDLQQEHQNAMEFGEAAAEEWVKGLPLLGKQQMADAARWERWEALLPLGSDIAKVLREYFRPSSASSVDEAPVAPPSVSATSLPAPPSTQSKSSPSGVFLLSISSKLLPRKFIFSLFHLPSTFSLIFVWFFLLAQPKESPRQYN